ARDEAKVGVLAASLIAALVATLLFRFAARRAQPVPETPVRLDRDVDPEIDHIRGRVDAPLTLVEYGDYECPFCGRATDVIDELFERLGDDLRYVYRHLPLTDQHPNAQLAAEAAEAAAAQGRFWEMHDALFDREDEVDWDAVVDTAQALGLDLDRFIDDLQERAHVEHVRLDAESAAESGVRGTPTFFVNGRRHEGEWDAESLVRTLASIK
ncbi:MAG TPA: DsbA family protein, partial [Solirubrobacteraceae bacterium]|nr:DsbA family protein [Solirubrobacteraceae bacterium]